MRTRLLASLLLTALAIAIPAAVRAQQAPAQSPAASAFAEGVTRHDAGDFAGAIPLFEKAITLGFRPPNQARFRLVRAHARAGNTEQALAELDTLAAAGFANTAVLASTDLDTLRALPRFQELEKRVDANARPCAADPAFRAFDFWIGEWDVQPTGTTRGPIGTGATSIIESQLDGCVIQENWLPPGPGQGKSFNTYNTVTKQWEQYYVDARGTITHYTGTFRDGTLYFDAAQFGTPNKIRMTFFNEGPDQVRQLGHISTDGGATWAVSFDLTYVRKKPAGR